MPQVEGATGRGKIATAADGTRYYTDSGLSAAAKAAKSGAAAATPIKAASKTKKSGSSGKSGGSSAAAKAAAEAAAQQAALEQLLGYLQQRLDAELASAQSWYERQSASIKSLYGNLAGGLSENYRLQLADLAAGYQSGVDGTNRQADAQRGEAYVSRMMSERGLGQKLSALGYAGGAAESTLLALANAYGQNVNKLETARADSLASQLLGYNSARSAAQQGYNSRLAQNAASQAKQLQSLDTGYANMISKAQNTHASQQAAALRKLI